VRLGFLDQNAKGQGHGMIRCAKNAISWFVFMLSRVVAYELRGEGLVWLIMVVVCLCAAPRVQLFANASSGWPHNAPRYH